MFASDYGYLVGEHRFSGKIVPYEESIRVRLHFRHPQMASGSSTLQLVVNNDLAPHRWRNWPGSVWGSWSTAAPWSRSSYGTPPAKWETLFLIEGYQNAKDGLVIPSLTALRIGRCAPSPSQMIGS